MRIVKVKRVPGYTSVLLEEDDIGIVPKWIGRNKRLSLRVILPENWYNRLRVQLRPHRYMLESHLTMLEQNQMGNTGKAANEPPRQDYAEVKFTAEALALEFDMTLAQAHAFLERYERWIGVEMIEAGREAIHAFAIAEGIVRYRDFEEFED